VLDQTAAPHVKRRDDRPCRVVLDGYGAGISVVMIYELGERHDPFVANPVGRVEADDASEIGLLTPELERPRELVGEERNDLVAVEARALGSSSEVRLGDALGEEAGVVAKAVH
jgi:hypothetical protein